MRKIFTLLFFSLFFCETGFAESYYFKECKISNAVTGNYIINLEKNKLEVELKTIDGDVQYFSDKIKLIEKKKIVSEKIKSAKGKDIFYQNFLDSESGSIVKLQFRKESGDGIDLFNLIAKRESKCLDIKSDWDKRKIEEAKISKEQEEIIEAQEKIKAEQNILVECQGNDYKQWTNCKGSFKAATGHKYNGMFKNGEIIKGTSLYPGGSKYVGDFENYLPHGYGTFVWANGDRYFGEWKNGKNHGNGTKIWKDGREYRGDFLDDKLHGEGTLYFPDGKKYIGGFQNGKRHGEGRFMYPDGTAYEGKFFAGKEQGVGECISVDGSSTACVSKIDIETQDFVGKETHNISITAKKWVRISQYETNTKKAKKIMDKLKADFKAEALKICAAKGSYNVLENKIVVLDLDETPAYGLETKLQIGINGVVECV